ncbi:hypothetical protein [Laspinema olomoucense]|uniref:hypothetical protein n=1 Tax=Laspinema olomoucense TaxID=3231600 RepID=UPI0021BB22A1|nr:MULTISPECIES: hypothetical protein [unclassified Laspinema]MCT7973696.1 hypothetical protein [Laspinema sp. D3d]MCT7996604.1 hypothetical protein [Laspinema sp. D3c]
MALYIQLKTGLIFGLISLVGLATNAIAQSSNNESFVYSCGTGCRITAVRSSEIETIRLADGSVANTALFTAEQVRNYGTAESYVAFTGMPRYFAICSTKRVGANNGDDFVPNPDWWVQLQGDDSDYKTVSGGRVHYFNQLCS